MQKNEKQKINTGIEGEINRMKRGFNFTEGTMGVGRHNLVYSKSFVIVNLNLERTKTGVTFSNSIDFL